MTLPGLLVLLGVGSIALAAPRNIVFIQTVEDGCDAVEFLRHSLLVTPHLNSMECNGVHPRNALVTTAMCSPGRASDLTGLHVRCHCFIDNNNPVRLDFAFFSQLLQGAGYCTGFFDKWHIGDAPQRGFDRWVSFRDQGDEWPDRRSTPGAGKDAPNSLAGHGVPREDHITDHALEWLRALSREQPFFLNLSHTGAHSEFVPTVHPATVRS